MPISKDEFRRGRTSDTTKALIEEFLKKNSNQAFTLGEIGTYLYGGSNDFGEAILKGLATTALRDDLDELIREGKIEVRNIKTSYGEEEYFAWRS